MPHSVNPAQGWIANWNNKPGPNWRNSSAGFWDWGPVHRVNTLFRIVEKILPRSASLSTPEAVNRRAGFTTDSPSGSADTVIVSTMLGDMLDAVDASADPRLPASVALLRSWNWLQEDADGDGCYDSPAVAVFNTRWEKAVGSILLPRMGSAADPVVCGNVMFRLLEGSRAALPVRADYLGTRSIGEAPTAALRAMNVISPGQSGDFRSPHFADQLGNYATWRYKPMRLDRKSQEEHAESVTKLTVP